jgi:type IV pilus assembly protein PilP
MMSKRIALSITVSALLFTLFGCGASEDQDIKTWMAEQGLSSRGKIQAIPPIRPYEPFTYNAFGLPDPFTPRKIESAKGARSPDLQRRKEALEAYPLETLTMVGTLEKGRALIGLVRASDKRVFQVRQGNYMGQNFGVITSITDAEISLKELFQDGAGDWAERQSKIMLQEREQKK